MPKFKPVPKFRTEDGEREFWATHDTTEYVDWKSARRVQFPNLKPSRGLSRGAGATGVAGAPAPRRLGGRSLGGGRRRSA